MSSTDPRRGFTLVEALIASSMTAMFLGLIYGMFLPVLGVASASSAKTDTLAAATTALYQLQNDLKVSTLRAVSVGTTPASLPASLGSSAEAQVLAIETGESYANPNDNFGQYQYDPTSGLSDMQSYVVWEAVPASSGACSSTNPCTLYRTTASTGVAPTVAAGQISSTALALITANIATSGRVMARNITSFEIAGIVVGGVSAPDVALELAAQSQDENGKLSQTSYQTEVFLRNN